MFMVKSQNLFEWDSQVAVDLLAIKQVARVSTEPTSHSDGATSPIRQPTSHYFRLFSNKSSQQITIELPLARKNSTIRKKN